MRFAVQSDKGIVRELNEDSYNILAGYPNVPVSFIIADGMGGHNSGEVASQMAVNIISNHILENPESFTNEEQIQSSLREVIEKANSLIYAASKDNSDHYGMGTTLILAVVCNRKLYIGHVGDSRVYVLRDANLEQITTDHSFIEELLKNGSITREEALKHPKRNLITRALGCMEEVEVDTYICNLKENDIYILCTDGLSNLVDEETLKNIVSNNEDPDTACRELIDTANSNGGEDNITVIVFKN
ncbi:MAG: Stp1/IreP family PP2C-type Ser/Thr phosphatase [Clostridia bacterium]|nr:Stp1/IreP family PP2C-type Ser/Thr phosphatase [Clostridia bacterium]